MLHRQHGLVPIVALAAWLAAAGTAWGIDLITEAEAKLPPALRTVPRGGITRGPSIVVVAPGPDKEIKAPFTMKVDFQAHGGAKIDPATVKVIYLKHPMVDLTPRLRAAISESGIDLGDVRVPPGTHDIKIDVSDGAGRTKTAVMTFTVVK